MSVPDQHVPLFLRQAFVADSPVGLLAPAAPAKGVGTGVPGVVQSIGGAIEAQRPPRQLALLPTGGEARGEEQALLPEVLDGGVHGARSLEGLEEAAARSPGPLCRDRGRTRPPSS